MKSQDSKEYDHYYDNEMSDESSDSYERKRDKRNSKQARRKLYREKPYPKQISPYNKPADKKMVLK